MTKDNEPPIRVLHVDTERTWRGGEQQAMYLAEGLHRRGHDSQVVGKRDSEFVRRARDLGLTAHERPLSGEINPRAVVALRSLLVKGSFDLIHAHTSHAHTQSIIAAQLAGSLPCIVSRRVDYGLDRSPWKVNRLKYTHGVARYIAISEAIRAVLIQGGVKESRISTVPSGISLERLRGVDPRAARDVLGLAPEVPLIGAVAHFAWHKGLEVLIDAIPRIRAARPDARFALVGDGELRADLMRRARAAAGDDVVFFPGFRPDAVSFLAAMDVVVCPSLMEGLNTTNLDALALRRAVVASEVGGIPEAIRHGETGLLFPKGDARRLADHVLTLLADRALAARLGDAGRCLVEERFTNDSMVEGTLRVYRSVLAGRHRPTSSAGGERVACEP